jgi:hypothetical protein
MSAGGLIGGIFGFMAMLLRRWLKETPVFEEMRRRAALPEKIPLQTVLRSHRRAIAASVLSTWMLAAAIVVVILMTPSKLNTFRLSFQMTTNSECRHRWLRLRFRRRKIAHARRLLADYKDANSRVRPSASKKTGLPK